MVDKLSDMRREVAEFGERVAKKPTGAQAQRDLEHAHEELMTQMECMYEAAQQMNSATYRREAMMAGMREAFILTDPMGIIKEANFASEGMFNVPIAWIPGKPLANFIIDVEVKTALRLMLIEFKKKGNSTRVKKVTLMVLRRRAGTHSYDVTVTALYSAAGEFEGCQWLFYPTRAEGPCPCEC